MQLMFYKYRVNKTLHPHSFGVLTLCTLFLKFWHIFTYMVLTYFDLHPSNLFIISNGKINHVQNA